MENRKIEPGYGLSPKTIFCDNSLTVGAKALAGLLLSFQGSGVRSFLSIPSISSYLRIDPHTTHKYIKELEKKPYFSKVKQRKPGQQFSNNLYYFDMSKLIETVISINTENDGGEPPHAQNPHAENAPNGEPHACFAHAENAHAKNNMLKNNKINIYTPEAKTVFAHWNNAGLIKHRELTQDIVGSINSALGKYSVEQVNAAVANYSAIAKAEPGKYYWTHSSWTLKQFLQRGLDRFVDDARPLERMLKRSGDTPRPKRDETYYNSGKHF